MTESSRVSIKLPELGSEQATFSHWHVAIGELVTEGDRVAEVLIPGAVYDVAAPASGTLVERHAHPGDVLQTGQLMGEIEYL